MARQANNANILMLKVKCAEIEYNIYFFFFRVFSGHRRGRRDDGSSLYALFFKDGMASDTGRMLTFAHTDETDGRVISFAGSSSKNKEGPILEKAVENIPPKTFKVDKLVASGCQ